MARKSSSINLLAPAKISGDCCQDLFCCCRMVTKAKAPAPVAPHAHVALDALLELNGEWHDKQRAAGVSDPNSGGNTIYLSPGLRLTVENWSSYVTVGVPIVKELNGIQPTPAWRVLAGVAAAFGP